MGGGGVQYYFEKLVQLADEQKINVYIMGGPVAESCAKPNQPVIQLDSTIEALKRFKTIHFEYAQRIPVPDALMLNDYHTDREGAFYFSEKAKPFFDAMP